MTFKRKMFVCLFSLAALILVVVLAFASNPQEVQTKNWGSFTWEKTCSFDGAYYAIQKIEARPDVRMIFVEIHDAASDEIVFSFSPARAADFWGICWETDSYNIWIQSADVGVECYAFREGEWTLDDTARRPENIVSKYDDI